MSVAAPGFALAVLGLGPGALHWWGYLLLWAVCSSLVGSFVHWKLSMTGLGYASRSVFAPTNMFVWVLTWKLMQGCAAVSCVAYSITVITPRLSQ